jgi:hypothetical protein
MSKSAIARELGLSWNTVAKVIAMAEERMMAQEPETEAVEKPMAAGAEYQSVAVATEKPTSSKMVRNNIVSYGEATPLVFSGSGQAVRNTGEPPDK